MTRRTLFLDIFLMILVLVVVLIFSISSFFIRTFSDYNREYMAKESTVMLTAVHDLLEAYFQHAAGQLTVAAEIAGELGSAPEETLEKYFSSTMDNDASIQYYQILSGDGIIEYVFPYQPDIIGNDTSGQPYFREAIDRGCTSWSTAVLTLESDDPVIIVTCPFRDGLITAQISLLSVLESVELLNAIGEYQFGVLDKNGVYILHSDISLVRQRVFSPFFRNDKDKGKAFSDIVEISGEEYYYATVPLEHISGTLLFYQSSEKISKAINETIIRLVLIVLVFLIVTVIIVFIGGKLFLIPIEKMQKNMNKIASGDYQGRLDESSYLELNGVINSMNVMSERIHQREKALMTARYEAEEANNVKLQFLANMSHELRTPLNGIFGMVNLLNGTELNAPQQQYLDNLGVSADNLFGIIQDLLDFSRIDSGKLALSEDPIFLKEVFDFTAQQMAFEAEIKGLEFNYRIDLPDERTLFDRVRLIQIAANILTNAIKFTEDGKVDFIISKKGQLLLMDVIDTGIGIDGEHQQKIFQSFVQLENTFSKKYQGLGLGLAITNSLVELHGGSMELKSSIGQGAHFRVILPYKNI